MKYERKMWKNKGNGQLLISIPKHSNLKNGDIVNIEFMRKGLTKEEIKKIEKGGKILK